VHRAVLLVSHGTVDDLDDLAAFVTNVRRGHAPSAELVAELRRRYEAIGGRSPLNAINSTLAGKLERKLGVPVAWANRLWKPYVRDVLAALVHVGSTDVTIVPLAQHSAHVYAQDARQAAEGTGANLACATNWGTTPGLCAAFAERIAGVLATVNDVSHATVVMTAHSLPKAVIARGDGYADEVHRAAEAIAAIVRGQFGEDVRQTVAFQSQAIGGKGPDDSPIEWLGPDVRTVLDAARARGGRRAVLAPIGFLADHVEVLYDLDIEARAMAEERGLQYSRAPSLNADDDLVDVLADVARKTDGERS
jgi:protoporphyrin/coproporphyrin ferrochelatase